MILNFRFFGLTLALILGCNISLAQIANNVIFEFTNAGQTGRYGPDQNQIDNAYTGTSLEGQVTVDGGIQYWTAPYTGLYHIETYGAYGGWSTCYEGPRGQGAMMSGEFELEQGDVLKILVEKWVLIIVTILVEAEELLSLKIILL